MSPPTGRRRGPAGRVRVALLLATPVLFGAVLFGAVLFGAVLFGVSGTALAANPAPSSPAPQAIFSLHPAQAGSTPLPGGHFNYSLPAGGKVQDGVVVQNLTTSPLTLQTFPADLIPLAGGGFGVAQLGQTMHSVGAWIQMQPSVTLAPQQDAVVPFTLTVPADTFSGDYGGAVVAENSPTSNRGFNIQTRVALQVRVHVTGANPRLDARVGPLQATKSGGSVRFSTVLTNTGNESFRFSGRVTLEKGGSSVSVYVPLKPGLDYLFPGQHVKLTGSWSHPPRWGSVTVRATVTATPAKGASATFTDQPVKLSFFPWALVTLAVLALLLLLAVLREAWKRRKEWAARLRAARDRRRAVRQFKQGLTDGEPPAGTG